MSFTLNCMQCDKLSKLRHFNKVKGYIKYSDRILFRNYDFKSFSALNVDWSPRRWLPLCLAPPSRQGVHPQAGIHIYITFSTFTSVCPLGVGVTFELQIPSVVLQSVTNKSCLICVKSKWYAFLVTTGPLGFMWWGEGELHTLRH